MFRFAPRQKITHDRSVLIDGKNYACKLVQNPLARTVRLKISIEKGLEIIVPRRFHPDHLDHIVAEHRTWILKQFTKLEERKKLRSAHQLQDGTTITVLGMPHTVKILPAPKQKPHVKRVQQLSYDQNAAVVTGHELHVHCDGSLPHSKKILETYLRKVAEKFFTKRTATLAEEMNVTFNNITVRGQKTRWGSCTRAKNLNFNWRLLLLDPHVAESVIIHELAHTVHMNHSKSFYALVERHCPQYRPLQKFLKHPQFPL